MNQDVKVWINYMNNKNRKRKRNAYDSNLLINELICGSVDGLIKIIKESNMNKNKIYDYLNIIIL